MYYLKYSQMATALNRQRPKNIVSLPEELIVEIVKSVPIAQWPSLELVSYQFQDAVHVAWRSLETIRVVQDLVSETELKRDYFVILRSILDKLIRRAPNLKSISGF